MNHTQNMCATLHPTENLGTTPDPIPLVCPHHTHLTPTLSTSPTEEARRCAVGNRSANLAGLGKAGPGTCGPSLTELEETVASVPGENSGTGVQRVRLSFP